ncbi:MAG: glycosyltransferase family 2 protein [Acholeplasmataceae bacterium]|nr:glycosyltransferase family 2 protein [Acholeplasmataceae bacterium]
MAEKIKIDIIIPSYNSKKYLAEAVDSCKAQTHRPERIIIVDDGSTDGSDAFARSLAGVEVFRQTNSGAGVARNHGISQSSAECVFLLDADDIIEPFALEALAGALAAEPDAFAVFGQTVDFFSPELTEEERKTRRLQDKPSFGRLPGCSLLRKEVFGPGLVGLFNPAFKHGEVVDWHSRFRDAGLKYVNVEKVIHRRRIHLSNAGIVSKETQFANYARILRQRLGKK